MFARRFPPLRPVEGIDGCFVVEGQSRPAAPIHLLWGRCRPPISLTRLLTPDAARQDRGRRQADLLAPAHERLHFFQGNGAIVVGIHGLEDAFMSRLPLL